LKEKGGLDSLIKNSQEEMTMIKIKIFSDYI
jgi:hypothetical protein